VQVNLLGPNLLESWPTHREPSLPSIWQMAV